jgi:hypothetical protein
MNMGAKVEEDSVGAYRRDWEERACHVKRNFKSLDQCANDANNDGH